MFCELSETILSYTVSLRPCDRGTYIRNIIFRSISEILFMCITDYFKLFSRNCAIKTLNLKFLPESKVKKFLYFNDGKNDRRTRNSICFFAHHTPSKWKWIRRKNWGGRFELGNGLWSRTKEELIMEFYMTSD